MAGSTGNGKVLVFEFKIRLRMIKIIICFDDHKRDLGVTLFTLLAELILMNVYMTIRAVLEMNTCKFLEFSPILCCYGMTFNTFNRLVLPYQWVLCGSMVEFCYRLESI